jgi:predicted  nucleic acid-binding Zn-ribbon protein
MSSIEEKIGYLTGVLEEVRDHVKAMPEEMQEIRNEFHQHMSDDNRNFKEIKQEVQNLRDYQNRQKWTISLIVTVGGLLTWGIAFADKIKGLFH